MAEVSLDLPYQEPLLEPYENGAPAPTLLQPASGNSTLVTLVEC
jgi:hypothetical protein